MTTSLLSWERGLKYALLDKLPKEILSLLSWERGLKSPLKASQVGAPSVAPLVGAWIEMDTGRWTLLWDSSRSSRGSVD